MPLHPADMESCKSFFIESASHAIHLKKEKPGDVFKFNYTTCVKMPHGMEDQEKTEVFLKQR